MGKYEYTFPKEDLHKLIEQIGKGIIPAVPEEMKLEAKMLYKEMQEELFEEGEGFITDDDIQKHQEYIQKKVEQEKHKAHRDNIKVAKISEKQNEKLLRAVSTSIVRPRYSDYNKTDEELYGNEQKKKLYEKLKNLKAVYRNVYDWKTAMQIVKDVIKYSLDHDYPGTPRSEVYAAWRRGEIKVNIPIPKLFSDYVHEIKDKDTLKGIFSGDIVVKNKSEIDNSFVKKDYSKSELVPFEYDVVSAQEFNRYAQLHQRGIDTPYSVIFENMGKVYNQFTLPSSNMFAKTYGQKESNGQIVPFDWLQDDAAEKYINRAENIDVFDPNNLANFLNASNGENLSLDFRNKIIAGSEVSSTPPKPVDPMTYYDQIIQKDPSTLALERAMLEAIQNSN